MTTNITHVAVVVPARNEAALLPATLKAIHQARERLLLTHPGVSVSITVALDCTTDISRELLACHLDVSSISVEAGRVGTARNAGIAAACAAQSVPLTQLWIANTDADTQVPEHWLQRHYELASQGVEVLVGTVEPGGRHVDPALLRRWFAHHDLREGHGHVHGANLGIRADVLRHLGGFPDQGLHEDRDLIAKARGQNMRVIATDSCRVTTSARLRGRAKGGFADFLAGLEGTRRVGPAPLPPDSGFRAVDY